MILIRQRPAEPAAAACFPARGRLRSRKAAWRAAMPFAFALTAVSTITASLQHSELGTLRAVVLGALSATGCAASLFYSVRREEGRATHAGTILGISVLVLVTLETLLATLFLEESERPSPVDFATLFVASLSFLLSSRPGFFLLAGAATILWLTTLASLSSGPLALSLGSGCLSLTAMLLARLPRSADDSVRPTRAHPARGSWGWSLAAAGGFWFFFFLNPDVPPPIDSLEPPPAPAEAPIPGFGRPGSASPELVFDHDLKFGNLAEEGVDSQAILMMAQLYGSEHRLIEGEDPGFPLLWRTAALGRYSGFRWSPLEGPKTPAPQGESGIELSYPRRIQNSLWIRQRIILAPMRSRGIFALGEPHSFDFRGGELNAEGVVSRLRPAEGPFRYSVISAITPRLPEIMASATPAAVDPAYLDVPVLVRDDASFQRILGKIQADGPSAMQVVERITELLSKYEYHRNPGLPSGRDPTLSFLQRGKGYCQHFASAMTLLLRASGIPARIAIGFAGGEWSESLRALVLRRRHAHAWVEVPFDGMGWIPFDPTAVARVPEKRNPSSVDPRSGPVPTAPVPEIPSKETARRETLGPSELPIPRPLPLSEPGEGREDFDTLWSRIVPNEDPPAPGATSQGSPGRTGSPPTALRLSQTDAGLILLAALLLGAFVLIRRRRNLAVPEGSDAVIENPRAPFSFKRRTVGPTWRARWLARYGRFLSRARRAGIPWKRTTTLREHAARVAAAVPQFGTEAKAAAALGEKALYSDQPFSHADYQAGIEYLRSLDLALERRRKE